MSSNRISEPYYLLHFLAFFSYILLWCSAAQVLSPLDSDHLLHRERQALLAFCVLAALLVVKLNHGRLSLGYILLPSKFSAGNKMGVVDEHSFFHGQERPKIVNKFIMSSPVLLLISATLRGN